MNLISNYRTRILPETFFGVTETYLWAETAIKKQWPVARNTKVSSASFPPSRSAEGLVLHPIRSFSLGRYGSLPCAAGEGEGRGREQSTHGISQALTCKAHTSTHHQRILRNRWTPVTYASSLDGAHRVPAWRTRALTLPSPNLRLIQALQPGLSRTSDLRRPVIVRPAPGSSSLPLTTATPASSMR